MTRVSNGKIESVAEILPRVLQEIADNAQQRAATRDEVSDERVGKQVDLQEL